MKLVLEALDLLILVPGGSTEFYKEDVVPSLHRPEDETMEKGPLLKEDQHHYIPPYQ